MSTSIILVKQTQLCLAAKIQVFHISKNCATNFWMPLFNNVTDMAQVHDGQVRVTVLKFRDPQPMVDIAAKTITDLNCAKKIIQLISLLSAGSIICVICAVVV